MDTILAPAGAICFAAIVIGLHGLRRDVDWRSRGVSHYATGPHGWIVAVAFAALAAALASRATHAEGGASWSAAIAAAGFLGVALAPTGGSVRRERVHTVCALAGFIGAGIAAALSSTSLGNAVLATVAAFLLSMRAARGHAGLFQRVAFLAIVLWLVGG